MPRWASLRRLTCISGERPSEDALSALLFGRLGILDAFHSRIFFLQTVSTPVRATGKGPAMNEGVQRYFDAVPEERKPLFDKLHALIMGLYPNAEVVMWYRMPTYRAKSGWVAMANQKHWVSLYTNSALHIAEFKAKYPAIRTGKACINFRDTDPVPLAAPKKVVGHAIEHPR